MKKSMLLIFFSAIIVTSTCVVISCLSESKNQFKSNTIMLDKSPEFFFDGVALEVAQAIEKNDIRTIQKLSPKIEINSVYRQGMTLLLYALFSQKHLSVTALINAGASPRQVDKELGSPLDIAVQARESDSLASILNAGVSPNAMNSWGTPLIFTAACLDSQENLKLLVERNANLDATEPNLGKTAIFEAVSQGCYDQVIYLIEHGAKLDIATMKGLTLAYSVQWDLEHTSPGSPAFEKLTKIKQMMQDRGIKFPAEAPSVVREEMKKRGLKVVE